jgi:hypothetical protein
MNSSPAVEADPEDWYVSCSDDEKYTSTGCERGKLSWTPAPEDMVRLFNSLDKVHHFGLGINYFVMNKLNFCYKFSSICS